MKFLLTPETFIISDSHFGHKKVLEKEPLRNALAWKNGFMDFDSFSVHMWNKRVLEDDFILHLGDLYFKDGWKQLLKLQGRKKLLVGNNDLKKYHLLNEFEDWQVCKKISLKFEGKKPIFQKLKKKWGVNVLKDKLLNAIVLDIGKERVMFSHFPVMNRKKNDRYACTRDVLDELYRLCECSLNIHGHTHSKNTKNPFCINVSGEIVGFQPIKIGEALSMKP